MPQKSTLCNLHKTQDRQKDHEMTIRTPFWFTARDDPSRVVLMVEWRYYVLKDGSRLPAKLFSGLRCLEFEPRLQPVEMRPGDHFFPLHAPDEDSRRNLILLRE